MINESVKNGPFLQPYNFWDNGNGAYFWQTPDDLAFNMSLKENVWILEIYGSGTVVVDGGSQKAYDQKAKS